MGDVVLTSSLIEPLARKNFKPILVSYKPYAQLFKEDSRLEIISIEKENFWRNFKSLVERINSYQPYAVFDLHRNLKTALLKSFLKASIKGSYKKRALRRRICIFLNRFHLADNLKKEPYSVVNAYMEPLKVLGIEISHLRPKIELNHQNRLETLKKHGLEGKNYIAIGVGARYKKKRYPYFEKLAKLLKEKGFNPVLIGDKNDFELTKDWQGVVNLCGKLSLLESLHILSKAKFYIGNDSGATHMARAVGTKVAVIYGGTHPCLGFAPFPDEGIVISKFLPCSPCDLHGKGSCKKDFECLKIAPEGVLSELERARFLD